MCEAPAIRGDRLVKRVQIVQCDAEVAFALGGRATGKPAPMDGPLSQTVNPVTVTIGGVNAAVQFAGLTPGYPDLYQVNAVVPAGAGPGGNVPVALTVAGQTSPPVTMAVR